jgi:hypothetical protein
VLDTHATEHLETTIIKSVANHLICKSWGELSGGSGLSGRPHPVSPAATGYLKSSKSGNIRRNTG